MSAWPIRAQPIRARPIRARPIRARSNVMLTGSTGLTGPCTVFCVLDVALCSGMSACVLQVPPKTQDLLESLVPAMVFNEVPTGSTGFTGPCNVFCVLDVILYSFIYIHLYVYGYMKMV